MSLPDVESLRQIFGYCPKNGDLVQLTGKRAGSILGSPNRNGYLRVKVRNRWVMVHKVIWALHHGEWPADGFLVDHKNRKRTDNRPRNLRLASHAQNAWNRAGDGVSFDSASGKWRARVQADGKRTHLGRFPTKRAALAAVKAALPSLQPEFGRTV